MIPKNASDLNKPNHPEQVEILKLHEIYNKTYILIKCVTDWQ